MKLRNLLITLGLTLTVGAGVAVATSTKQNEEPKAAEAATNITIYCTQNHDWANVEPIRVHQWGGTTPGTSWGWNTATPMVDAFSNQYGEKVYKLDIPSDRTGIIFLYRQGTDLKQSVDITSGISNNAGWAFTDSWPDGKNSVTTWTVYPYTINYNGNGSTSGSMSSETGYGNVKWGLTANTYSKTGYLFVGWNTEADGSGSSYDDEGLLPIKNNTTAVTVYAQWAYTNPTVYFVNGYSWGQPYVYYWGGDTSVDKPGVAMTKTDAMIHCIVDDTWYDIFIWKCTISGSPTGLLFDDGTVADGHKTGDLVATNGLVGWWHVDAGTFGGVANYLITFEGSMGSYTYNGQSYSKSICNLGGSASSLVSSYNTLLNSGGNVATSVANSKIVTYSTPVTSPSSTGTIAMSTLIAQIEKNISNSGNGALRIFGLLDLSNNNGALIVVVISSLGILSVGAYYFFKKSKKSEE